MFLNLFTNIQSRLLDAKSEIAAQKEQGAVAVEYALLVVLIALVMAIGAATLGTNLNLKFAGITI